MASLYPVPEVAAGATEVLISEWLVKPGDSFKVGDPLAVIETEKAVVEVEAEADATLLRQLVEPGSTVDVGSPMALLGSQAEVGADLDALLVQLGVSGSAASNAAEPKTDVPDSESESPAPGQDPAPQHQAAVPPQNRAEGGLGDRVFISPIARKLLKDAGLTTDDVTGSGPKGRIRRRDVEPVIAAAARPTSVATGTVQDTATGAAQPSTAPSPGKATVGAGWTEVPHSRLRRAVARRLTESKQQVPHFYVRRTAVLDDLLALRAQVNAAAPTKVSVNDFLIRAMAVAHRAVPEANVIWTDEAMRSFDSVDISVAIASEKGLVTPVLRGVENSSLSSISAQVKTYVEQANAGRLNQSDLEGGSITISNLGMFGVDEFSAIINPPQSAILAVGAARPAPVVVGDRVEVKTAVELVLSVDHRAIDGALAAQWMTALVEAIEQPMRLLV
jgi:pyruvate dehydrogenase E2 component (dihydrolipoamide acetyltransferase)